MQMGTPEGVPNSPIRPDTAGTWGWCTGMTQRDGMGREEGGGVYS